MLTEFRNYFYWDAKQILQQSNRSPTPHPVTPRFHDTVFQIVLEYADSLQRKHAHTSAVW